MNENTNTENTQLEERKNKNKYNEPDQALDDSRIRQIEEKIHAMESHRGRNRPLDQVRKDLKAEKVLLPEHAIQVAGTNGKGSVSMWLALLMAQKGLHTGLFTSPHLKSHTERIRYDFKNIPLFQWEEIYDRRHAQFDAAGMTMFEMDLWMALDYFGAKKPDWVIMEVGMGGERDATTALDYDAGIITHIGLDHMAFLGSSKKEIAKAKAGIMKPGMPVVTMEQDPECLQVFEQRAEKTGARLIALKKQPLPDGLVWRKELPDWQQDNFLLAKACLEELGFAFTSEELNAAIAAFSWKGRFDLLRKEPLLLLDGAHNPDGIEALCKSLKDWTIEQIFFSVLADKQAHEMIADLRALTEKIILVEFESGRLADLQQLGREEQLEVIDFDTMCRRIEKTEKPMLVCGSLYFAAEVLRFAEEQLPKQDQSRK